MSSRKNGRILGRWRTWNNVLLGGSFLLLGKSFLGKGWGTLWHIVKFIFVFDHSWYYQSSKFIWKLCFKSTILWDEMIASTKFLWQNSHPYILFSRLADPYLKNLTDGRSVDWLRLTNNTKPALICSNSTMETLR